MMTENSEKPVPIRPGSRKRGRPKKSPDAPDLEMESRTFRIKRSLAEEFDMAADYYGASNWSELLRSLIRDYVTGCKKDRGFMNRIERKRGQTLIA